MTHRRPFIVAALALCLLPLSVVAQTSPLPGPVRITSIFAVGSGPDAAIRVIADKLPAAIGQPILIDAKPGASGFIAAGVVKGAASNGQELLLADVGTLATNMSLFKKPPYDSERDFVPVALLYRTTFMVAVSANSPYQNVKELLAAAAEPNKVSYMSNGAGSVLHLGAAQLEAASGTKMLHVPYRDVQQGITAVATGEVTWFPASLGTAGPLLRAGKLKLLAVMDDKRLSAMPDLPTLAESGGPKGVQAVTWVALMAPKGTPSISVEFLNKAVNQALADPDVVSKLSTFGFQPAPATPAQLHDLLAADVKRHADLVRRTGATAD